jgi:hypothetical protein
MTDEGFVVDKGTSKGMAVFVNNAGQESVGLMRNLLRGMDDSQKYPDLSLHSYHYAPQNHAVFGSSPHLLATITLSPTDS